MRSLSRAVWFFLWFGCSSMAVAAPSLLYDTTLAARPFLFGARMTMQAQDDAPRAAAAVALLDDVIQLFSCMQGVQEHGYNHLFLPLWAGVDALDVLYQVHRLVKKNESHRDARQEDHQDIEQQERSFCLQILVGFAASSLHAYCMHMRASTGADRALRLKLEATASVCRAITLACLCQTNLAKIACGGVVLASMAAAVVLAQKEPLC